MKETISVVAGLLSNATIAPYVICLMGLGVSALALYVVLVVLRQGGKPKR